jgi:hypothetical protein
MCLTVRLQYGRLGLISASFLKREEFVCDDYGTGTSGGVRLSFYYPVKIKVLRVLRRRGAIRSRSRLRVGAGKLTRT